MELKERKGSLAKVRSIIFAMFAIAVWVAKLSNHLLGSSLGDIICSTAQKLKHASLPPPPPSSLVSSSAISSRPESSSSTLGDFLGSESGVHMSSEIQEIVMEKSKPYKKKSQLKEAATKREFPPPIPPRPWVLTREYKDGRLIIRQQMIQIFETQREDDLFTIEELHSVEEEEEEEEEEKNGSEEEKIEGEAIALPSDLLPEPVIEETGSENKADVQSCPAWAGNPKPNASFFDFPIAINNPIYS